METFMDFLGLPHLTNVLLIAIIIGGTSENRDIKEKMSTIIDLLYEIRPQKKDLMTMMTSKSKNQDFDKKKWPIDRGEEDLNKTNQ